MMKIINWFNKLDSIAKHFSGLCYLVSVVYIMGLSRKFDLALASQDVTVLNSFSKVI